MVVGIAQGQLVLVGKLVIDFRRPRVGVQESGLAKIQVSGDAGNDIAGIRSGQAAQHFRDGRIETEAGQVSGRAGVLQIDLLAVGSGEEPESKAAVGTTEPTVRVVRYLEYSLLMKKNVRFLMMGPPTEYPNWLRTYGSCGVGAAIEKVARTQRVVTAEPVGIAVKLVGPAPRDDVDDRAGVPSVFGVEVVGDDAEFLRRIRIDGHDAAGAAGDTGVVVVHAIEQEVVVATS